MTYFKTTTKAGFETNADGSLICIHRDLSCCKPCAEAHQQIVDVYGAHFWIDQPAERQALLDAVS